MGNIICAIHAILRLESTESLQKFSSDGNGFTYV